MVFKFFDKKISNGTVKNKVISNKELTEELHKPITNKFEKRKFYSTFLDNINGIFWNCQVNLKKDLDFYVLLIFIANIHLLFLKKKIKRKKKKKEKKELQLRIPFKKF